jgi:hypothetical protein
MKATTKVYVEHNPNYNNPVGKMSDLLYGVVANVAGGHVITKSPVEEQPKSS